MAYKTIIGTMKTAGTLDISSGDIDLAAGSVDNADLAGSIANSKLANSSVTVTAGDGLSGGGSVSLGGSVSVAVDLNELTAATLAVDEDFIVFIDNDGNASRKEAFSDAISAVAKSNYGLAAGSGQLALSSSAMPDGTVAVASDKFIFFDADGSPKSEAVADLADAFAGDGLQASSGVLALKLESNTGLVVSGDKLQISGSALGAGAPTLNKDTFMYFKEDGSVKQESFADYATAIAGDGLAASAGVLAVGVDDSTVELDSDALRVKAAGINVSHLNAAVAGDGLSGGAGSALALDLNELTAAAVAVGADSIAIIDADDNSSKKESIADLVTAMAGDGLEASSGVLAIKLESNAGLAIDGDKLQITGSALGAGAPTLNKDGFMYFKEDGSVKQESFADYATAIAGDGLAASAGVLAVGVDDSSIELNSDALRVKASGVTNAMLAGSIANAKLANSAITIAGTSTSLGGSITAFAGVTDVDAAAGNLTIFDTQQGSGGTLTIGHASGVTKIAGKLQVVGSMDTVSATELLVEDLTIKAANGAADSSAADGAGLKIGGASSTLLWDHSKQFMSFNKDVQLNGLTGKLQKISGDTTLTQASFLVRVDTSGGAVTVTLPSSMPEGKVFVIKDKGAAATNNITIATAGSETIDGAASISIISNHGAANLMFDGDNYLVW